MRSLCVAPGSRFDMNRMPVTTVTTILSCFGKNNTGLRASDEDRVSRFCRRLLLPSQVDKEILRKYHEGIIALSACLAGRFESHCPGTIMPRKLLRMNTGIFSATATFPLNPGSRHPGAEACQHAADLVCMKREGFPSGL